MSDPRFFRKYLDLLGEQDPTTATADISGAKFTADKNTNTLSGTTNVGGTDVSATRNLSTGDLSSVSASGKVAGADIKAAQDFSTAKQGVNTVSVNAPVAPGTTAGATYTQAGYKGQMAPSSQVSMSYKDTTGALGTPGQTHNVRIDRGVGFGGAGKNIQPGQNIQTTYTKT